MKSFTAIAVSSAISFVSVEGLLTDQTDIISPSTCSMKQLDENGNEITIDQFDTKGGKITGGRQVTLNLAEIKKLLEHNWINGKTTSGDFESDKLWMRKGHEGGKGKWLHFWVSSDAGDHDWMMPLTREQLENCRTEIENKLAGV